MWDWVFLHRDTLRAVYQQPQTPAPSAGTSGESSDVSTRLRLRL